MGEIMLYPSDDYESPDDLSFLSISIFLSNKRWTVILDCFGYILDAFRRFVFYSNDSSNVPNYKLPSFPKEGWHGVPGWLHSFSFITHLYPPFP